MTEILRTLDWAPNHDPRSLDFPVRELLPVNGHRHDRLWATPSVVLDQGKEGACTGFAFAHEALAEPIPVDLKRLRINAPEDPTKFALFLYGMARYLDPWDGEAYDGTSTLAAAQAAQNAGLLTEYRWAFGLDDVIDTVVWKGPVVIGINWYSGMYEPVGGVLRKSGKLVGGHCLCVVGYRKSSVRLGGKPAAVLLNSWGPDWGTNGLCDISLEDLGALLAENGEAVVPVRRSYGR